MAFVGEKTKKVSHSATDTSAYAKLPTGQKVRGQYDLIICKKSWDWLGPDIGFLPRISKLRRVPFSYSIKKVERMDSTQKLKKYFIDLDLLPVELKDECMSMYHVGQNHKGEKIYHYASVGEEIYTDDGYVCSTTDQKVYAKFVSAVCEQFKIPSRPTREFVDRELKDIKKTLEKYKRRMDRPDAEEMIEKLTQKISEIEAWKKKSSK